MFNRWKKFILSRFSDREDLSKNEVYQRYWHDLSQEEVMEFFKEIECFYSMPAGLLRPDDDVKKLVEPDKPDKWYKPVRFELQIGELETVLAEELTKRMKRYNISVELDKIRTVDDLIRVWCGQKPKVKDNS
jgi:hypothetical protein